MSSTGPALLAAAAGVGFGHAILPDHWVPLAVLGRTRRYPLSRVARLSAWPASRTCCVSLVLGAVIIAIGLQFRSTIQSAQDTIIGCVLIATGLGFAVLELTGHGHDHDHEHDHDHGHDHDHAHDEPRARGGVRGLAAVMVPFGAAASPDLTILPVFLAATTAGRRDGGRLAGDLRRRHDRHDRRPDAAPRPAAIRSAASGSSAGATRSRRRGARDRRARPHRHDLTERAPSAQIQRSIMHVM